MQEIISQIVARVQTIFSQLGDQVRAAMENAAAGKAILAALDVILPVASGVLRILAVFVAILIIVRCCRSIFREKPGKEIWGWLTLADGARLELCHWENALGRGKWADVDLDFPTVSRSHAALLRDHKGNWTLQPLQTKNGTRVNGKKVTTTVPVQTGDVIDLGGVGMEFYAISEAEEREQAMRWGVAERPLSPGRTLGCLMVFQLMLAVQCLPGREKGEVAMIAVAFGILMAAMWFTYGIYRALKRTAFEAETIAFFLCSICFGITAAYSPKSLLTQTKLLADDTEDQVRVGRADVFQERGVPRPLAKEAAAGDGGHGAGLLEAAGVGGVLPDVVPGPEAIGDVGLVLQDHPAPGPCRRGHEGQKAHVAGAQEGNDQQGHEEDEGRAEVTHQGQTAHAEAAEENGKDQISPGKEPVQRGRAGEDKGDLHELRGLEADGADGDPVLGTEDAGA